MKTTLFLLIMAIGVAAFTVGCSSTDTKVLEDKISQLEQQLNSQNASNHTSSSSQTGSVSSSVSSLAEQNNTNAPSSSNNAGSQQQTTTNNNQTQTPTNFDLTDITQKVNNVIQVADSTQPGANYSENISIYGQVNMQMEQVEFELDQLEHQIEYASRSGSLNWDQYRQLDRSLDELDARLDIAKDSLELRLRIDD